MGLSNSKIFRGWSTSSQWDEDFVLSDFDSVTPLFRVSQANGNTLIAGNLSVTGSVTASGGVAATSTNALNSATTTVNVSSAAAPTSGQVLTATGASSATWQSPLFPFTHQNVVSGSRNFSTNYQNTNSTPMFVSVSANDAFGSAVALTALSDSGSTPATVVARVNFNVSSVNNLAQLTFLVLPGNYYSVQQSSGTSSATTWTEYY